jgi:hypothetical protein
LNNCKKNNDDYSSSIRPSCSWIWQSKKLPYFSGGSNSGETMTITPKHVYTILHLSIIDPVQWWTLFVHILSSVECVLFMILYDLESYFISPGRVPAPPLCCQVISWTIPNLSNEYLRNQILIVGCYPRLYNGRRNGRALQW